MDMRICARFLFFYLCPVRKTLIISLFLAAFLPGCKKDILPESGIRTGEAEKTDYYQYGLGNLVIETDGGKAVDSKESWTACTVILDGGGVFRNHGAMKGSIRGRGNSTWFWYPKKPYRIKLDESTRFMGMEANRDWVLLADFRDVTHLMNNVAFTLANELGLPCANRSRYVTLTINGQDMGLYMATEQIEEGGNRVPLDKKEGILLALDMNDGPAENPGATDNFFSSVFKAACAVKYPKDPDKAAVERVQWAYAELETAIGRRKWADIQKLLDVDSMINYILVQEIIGNGELDNNPSMQSGYIHRPSDSAKWVMGPFWDADSGFGYDASDMFNWNGMCHTYFVWNTLVFGTEPYLHTGAMNGTASDFFCRLWGIPEFVRMLKARWNQSHEHLLEVALDQIDKTEAVIGEAAASDGMRWGINKFNHAQEVENLKNWITGRFSYLDSVIGAYPEKEY